MGGKEPSDYPEKEIMRRHLLASVLSSVDYGQTRDSHRSLTTILQDWVKKLI